MTDPHALYGRILERLSEALGKHSAIGDRNNHWSLAVGDWRAPINLLAANGGQSASVWVFDPHDGAVPAEQCIIRQDSDLTRLIERLRARLADIRDRPAMSPGTQPAQSDAGLATAHH
jgi:hypothetical protein